MTTIVTTIIPATAEIQFGSGAKQELMLYFKSGLGFFWTGRDSNDPVEDMAYVDPQTSPFWACHWLDTYMHRWVVEDILVEYHVFLRDARYCFVWDMDHGDFREFNYRTGGEVSCG